VGGSVTSPKFFGGSNIFTFSEQQYFVWGNTSQSTKRQEMPEIQEPSHLAPLATPMPASDLLVPCGGTGARGHHIGDP